MPKRPKNNQKKPTIAASQPAGTPWYQRVRNIIIMAAVVIIVAVGGWSIYYFPARPFKQTAMKVNDINLDMRYFINMCKLYYGKAPADSSIADFADFVELQIEQTQKVILGSKALGVEIPRSNVESELARVGTPVTRESVDLYLATDLILKQVPSVQPQYNVQAMLLENEAAAQSALARLQAGEDFLKVNNELSKFPAGSTNTTNLGWVTARQADMMLNSQTFGGLISNAGVGVLNGPVYDDAVSKQFGYWVAKIVEWSYASDNITPIGAHFEGILAGSEQDAENILDKLNTGADINELAKQVSLMPGAKDNGAEIGWLAEGQDPALYDALSDRPLNTIAGPIGDNRPVTTGGYWVYKLLEKNDSMPLTEDQQGKLQDDLLARCAAALAKDPNFQLQNLLTPEMKDFALNQVVLAQGAGSVLIGTNTLPVGEQGVNYNVKLQAYGEQKGNTWSITDGSLPDGLTLDQSTGVISGVPVFGGGGGFTIKVQNALHYFSQNLTIRMRVAITVATKSLPGGKVGEAYSATLAALSDTDTYTWSVTKGSLPDGLSLAKDTGDITGTPTTAGTFNFTVQADDGLGKGTQDLTILVP